MKTLEKIKSKVETIVKSSKDENIIKELGGVLGEIDKADTEFKDLENKHNALIHDYGKLVVTASSAKKPDDPEKLETPKTLEDIIKDTLHK